MTHPTTQPEQDYNQLKMGLWNRFNEKVQNSGSPLVWSSEFKKALDQAIQAERKRIETGLHKLDLHGLDVNIRLDEAIDVVNDSLKEKA